MTLYAALLPLFLLSSCSALHFGPGSTFSIGDSDFLLNGKPFRYISGGVHYFRIPSALWNDRLQRIRAAGLNAIQFYTPWNFHEERPGEFNFKGDRDIGRFLELARDNELYALVRVGPYTGGEWENGGLPWWILKEKDIKMRTHDPRFLRLVDRWYKALLEHLRPLLLKNGGNVLMLQVENEYGEYWTCDHEYTEWVRDAIWNQVGKDVVLYTTDQPYEKSLSCGTVAGVFPTIDFGPASHSDIDSAFALHRRFYQRGPYVNSELYPGWMVKWGQSEERNPSLDLVIGSSNYIYSRYNASFNYYMFHGGTNFEFWVGSQPDSSEITSYDYYAPISEAGDITFKYTAIRNWIKSIPDWSHPPLALPKNNTKVAYGSVQLNHAGHIFDLRRNVTEKCAMSVDPLSFEEMDVPFGYVLYETNLTAGGKKLSIADFKDYVYVYVDGDYKGVLVDGFYGYQRRSLEVNARPGQTLILVVENRGRISYDTINDYKGILSKVFLDGQVLSGWKQCSLNPEKVNGPMAELKFSDLWKGGNIFVGTFDAPIKADTFLDTRGWGKGQVYINGRNIGRYWAKAGPQKTLYIPGCFLKDKNRIVVMELLGTRMCPDSKCFANFIDYPVYEYAAPDSTKPFDPPASPKVHINSAQNAFL
ncbi:hypothetical protein QR680_005986 [Steinernema hermaphroditum]|uniref:Beta-galactosidase n=1 Tax=Steinernema hermaphroditum TaxID=289476 RepID=A0AA39HV16_9BILA|nr:hypothetical protein QR680_005986 [Steinernema hermaphroditum]